MWGTIPVIRVNYTIGQLIKSAFVAERSDKYRKQLTEMLSTYFSNKNILLTSSARSAIYQIVRSLPQRKVVVPAYTCEVVIEAVMLAEKEIVYADIDETTLNIKTYPEIDADTIVIATHQYGIMSEVKKLAEECRAKGAVLIEDCAGSFGGRIGGRLTGTFGDYGVFSFSASKTVHSPTKGGFIVARDKNAFDNIMPLPEIWRRPFKFKCKQIAKGIGFCLANKRLMTSLLYKIKESEKEKEEKPINADYSYHHPMYEWQAYVVLHQFPAMDARLMERRKVFLKYHSSISNPLVQKPIMQWGGQNIRYAVLIEDRKRFIAVCLKNNIAVGQGYHKLYCPKSCKTAHEVSRKIVYLPFGNGFSDEETDKVIEIVNAFK
jgi:dTDP-4-amino-4,6-dideoxygalactose transaminase